MWITVINLLNLEKNLSEAVTKILTEGFSGAWDAIKVLFF